jgi:post-segregation antitoxin (ccd killing protein)
MATRKVRANLSVRAREREQARWLAENEEAIDDYNAHVARNGSFGDANRRF